MENQKNFSEEDLENIETAENISDLKPNTEETAEDPKDLEIARLKDELTRAVAETENVRKRGQKDKDDAMKYGVTSFAREIVQVADNLERALASIKPEDRKENNAIEQLFVGVDMTEKILLQSFDKAGIKKISPKGEAFDHNYHQAMVEVETNEHEAGTVVEVFQPGYVIHARLLRPAMVSVAKAKKQDESDKDTPESLDTQA